MIGCCGSRRKRSRLISIICAGYSLSRWSGWRHFVVVSRWGGFITEEKIFVILSPNGEGMSHGIVEPFNGQHVRQWKWTLECGQQWKALNIIHCYNMLRLVFIVAASCNHEVAKCIPSWPTQRTWLTDSTNSVGYQYYTMLCACLSTGEDKMHLLASQLANVICG